MSYTRYFLKISVASTIVTARVFNFDNWTFSFTINVHILVTDRHPLLTLFTEISFVSNFNAQQDTSHAITSRSDYCKVDNSAMTINENGVKNEVSFFPTILTTPIATFC